MIENQCPSIFVGGMFKSGTSLLRAMLGRHSQIASGLETYWFDLNWHNLSSEDTSERLRIIRELYEIEKKVFDKLILDSSTAEEFISRLMAYWAVSKGKKCWAEKTPGNIHHLDRIYNYWPDAVVIHIIRDPRDIFASLLEAKKWNTTTMFMEKWIPVFKSVENFQSQGLLKNNKYIEIKYEDLVKDPVSQLENMCDELHISFEGKMANFEGEKSDFSKVKAVTGKESTTLARLAKPLMTSRTGIWKEALGKKDLDELQNFANEFGLSESYKKACYE